MKTTLFNKIFIISLMTSFFITQISTGEDVVLSDSSIKIDNHLIYIVQQSDLNTILIDEYIYINNTGNTSFNDSMYFWIPDNSIIIADCCDETPNMGCRNDENDEMWCFYFNKTIDNNIYVGYPISNDNRLSYYGQKESFTVTTFSTTNSSLGNDNMQLNATIGGSYISRENESLEGEGLHITSENQEIGLIPGSSAYSSFNITGFERIQIFNNGSDIETIEISISDLPEDWSVIIWNDTSQINNFSLSPQEYENLTLVITAPSYLASIYVGYKTQIGVEGNEDQGSILKKYLYETKTAFYNIYSITSKGMDVSEDLISVHDDPIWYEEYGMYWILAKAENAYPNDISTIHIGLVIPPKEVNPSYIIILALIIISIVILLILKKKDFFKETETSSRVASSEKGKKELQKEKRSLQEMIKRTESDLTSGLMDEKSAKKMKNEYRTQIEEINKKLGDQSKNQNIKKSKTKTTINHKKEKVKKLEGQKKEVLSAIKKVEKEFEDEVISKEDYERFRAAYKKRAVEILKEIDNLKE